MYINISVGPFAMHHAYLWCITHLANVWPRSLSASMHQLMMMHRSKPSFTLSLPHLAFPHPLQPIPSLSLPPAPPSLPDMLCC